MKIAVFYNLYFSGAKRTVFEHVKGLKGLGHEVDVYTTDLSKDIFDPGVISSNEYRYLYQKKVINFPFFRKITNDFSDFYLLKILHKKIAKDIDDRNYDIVLVHTDNITQTPFILRFLKTKNVYFCLEPLKIGYEYGLRVSDNLSIPHRIYETMNRYIRKRIDRENAQSSNYSLSISNFGRELMIQAFDLYPKVSYLGVDTAIFKKINVSKKNQILFIGQKLKMNGYDYALEAMKLIPQKIRPELKVVSISKNKKNRLTDREIVKLYNESILTLSLSNYDTFGLVPLESLACQTPVVAFNVAGYRETMINGKTGFLVDFDAKEIADKCSILIQNKGLNDDMSKFGKNWVLDNWSWALQIRKLEKFLIEVSIY